MGLLLNLLILLMGLMGLCWKPVEVWPARRSVIRSRVHLLAESWSSRSNPGTPA